MIRLNGQLTVSGMIIGGNSAGNLLFFHRFDVLLPNGWRVATA
ncbi:MAG TPA: hypothetical protein VFR67_28900 [Pilimelia sp.]|nr:hypothetical protein [Pilimelia sp.]